MISFVRNSMYEELLLVCVFFLVLIGLTPKFHSKTSLDFGWHQQGNQERLGSLKVSEVQQAFRKGMQEFLKGGDSIRIRFFASSRDEIYSGHKNKTSALAMKSLWALQAS